MSARQRLLEMDWAYRSGASEDDHPQLAEEAASDVKPFPDCVLEVDAAGCRFGIVPNGRTDLADKLAGLGIALLELDELVNSGLCSLSPEKVQALWTVKIKFPGTTIESTTLESFFSLVDS